MSLHLKGPRARVSCVFLAGNQLNELYKLTGEGDEEVVQKKHCNFQQ